MSSEPRFSLVAILAVLLASAASIFVGVWWASVPLPACYELAGPKKTRICITDIDPLPEREFFAWKGDSVFCTTDTAGKMVCR